MDELAKESDFEEVLTVSEYYDGARQGIANFNAVPHFYDCIWSSEQDEYSDVYHLTPIQKSVLDDALEEWAIFRRWELAFHTGEATIDTHPGLPAGSARSKELRGRLDEALKTDTEICVSRRGEFKPISDPNAPRGVLAPMLVKWSELP